ncbi:EIIABC-Fru [Slackia heliotrinireducens]|uniref:PTS system D-fructose-specific IIA component (F1P-forming)/PTS system D-fructose-specific IIB component (F1P-forming)/PTS system D-fructose-specific IIC component (F1P-forming) n=1 Tax=Slackia heliotrinireducens (strain ATCC 29202 / DSM 20476 / NCTC 11029 / RHS 1) TaxID=471855 RepID=C7N617_SLAHD|nr:fructose-specific PTS transporter subunit EIIC [Slackia heliotrinireducens]ACV22352.1 PTS system D-fructose-specific IIA component (F1P-forming)/PTS system D-fructose-specific IIB component (F1P-forming)/PTS system D-fructose-specific IIC component (F1P-forming) [Slackia heliotrinireducens DSM 20476]VEH00608.1 EIIABC-Fru [Slackia heliotrinireducens]
MRIVDLLKEGSIKIGATAADKPDAIEQLIALHEKAGNLNDVEEYRKAILAREAGGTTAIGEGMAIPHAKTDAVAQPALAAMTVPDGVDYEAPDGKPSNLLFMIAAPSDGDVHLEVLSRLMTMLMDMDFRSKLLGASTPAEFLQIIDAKEIEKFGEPEPAAEATAPAAAAVATAEPEGYRVLAVTACPTGIAHTYMAAEALAQEAEKMGVPIKVETNGSGGAKNILTADEIAAAEGIIVAADKNVEMARFDGKPVVITKVADGINKPKELINRALDGSAPLYHHTGAVDSAADSAEGESIGRQIYKHLMEGVSHMLPFVVAGGIFIALAFLIDTLLGAPQDGNFGSNTPVAAWFKGIGGVSFGFMLPILAGYIGRSIADRPGLLVGFVGGSMAAAGCTFADPAGQAVSAGFLGALLAGFAGGYFMLWFEKVCENIPQALDGMKPMLIYPLVGLAFIGIFMCAVNPIMIAINAGISSFLTSLGSAKILLGILLGGMMAIDMGGPINKAAYLFGLAAIESGNYDMMAAVMIGGMVPPLAIALACTFFKDRWTETELKSAPVNYIMGLSFITEGAIPYAAADPLRVIPACVVGSAVAGAISMAFGCTLMAPHGGIFVFAVVGNWPMYLVALAIGAVVGALMLRVLKKKVA